VKTYEIPQAEYLAALEPLARAAGVTGEPWYNQVYEVRLVDHRSFVVVLIDGPDENGVPKSMDRLERRVDIVRRDTT
jgi:hypothetical protein